MVLFKSKPQVKGFVGISLAPNKISVARILSQGANKPRLELLETIRPQSRGSQAQILADIVKKHRLTNAPCSLVLEPDTYKLLQVETPNVESGELREAVRWKIKDMVDFDVADAVIDIFHIPAQGLPNRSKFLYAAAAYEPRVNLLADEIKTAGLALSTIDIGELALRNIGTLFPADKNGAAMLYIGENQSLINLARDAAIYLTRSLPLTLGQMQRIDGSLDKAGEATAESGGLLDRLILEIQRLLGYYESYFSQPPISTLLLSPTDPELPNFLRYANDHLGIAVDTLDLNGILEIKTPLTPQQQSDGLLAIGAALRQATEAR